MVEHVEDHFKLARLEQDFREEVKNGAQHREKISATLRSIELKMTAIESVVTFDKRFAQILIAIIGAESTAIGGLMVFIADHINKFTGG